jgi:hypothetical protein
MQEAKTYRQYAADCRELARKMSKAEDKDRLLEMAMAWEARAEEAERQTQKKKDGGRASHV